MKKILFAVAALALCGAAFAATYDTNTLSSSSFDLKYFEKNNEAITLNVNKTVTFGYFSLNMMNQPLVLNFVGSNTFSSTDDFTIQGWGSTSVTGDSTAATSWESKLLENAGTAVVITLADSTADYTDVNLGNTTFMNASSGGSITLGNTQLTYRGRLNVDDMGGGMSMDDVKSYISDNQVVLVGASSMSGNVGGLYLVGKVGSTPATPEPATATLSLLALAGMVTRRRRK